MTQPQEIDALEIDTSISRFTVAFIYIDGGKPAPMGSGTLVRSRTTQGILTCAHVLEELKRAKRYGVLCFGVRNTQRQGIAFDASDTVAHGISFYDPKAEQDGPDIAFIPIPLTQFGSLSALGSVYDLDHGLTRATSQPSPETVGYFEAVAGIVGEMTGDASISGQRIILEGEGLVNAGQVTDTRTVDGRQMLTFTPKPAPDFELPKNYRGTSGGGLWRLLVDGDAKVIERRLMGVAFFQRCMSSPDHVIDCHGPDGIYKMILGEIYQTWKP